MEEENLDQLQRQIFQLENQISALSDQVWALMRDGKSRMTSICERIDAGNRISESDLVFLRGMIGCLLAELNCREVNQE